MWKLSSFKTWAMRKCIWFRWLAPFTLNSICANANQLVFMTKRWLFAFDVVQLINVQCNKQQIFHRISIALAKLQNIDWIYWSESKICPPFAIPFVSSTKFREEGTRRFRIFRIIGNKFECKRVREKRENEGNRENQLKSINLRVNCVRMCRS